jgi:hypothetical protein
MASRLSHMHRHDRCLVRPHVRSTLAPTGPSIRALTHQRPCSHPSRQRPFKVDKLAELGIVSKMQVETFTNFPEHLETLLKAHVPQSLPLLRRLQFAKYKGGQTADSRIVLVSDEANDGSVQDLKFTVAYLDFSGGPETQMWLYSTLEDHDGRGARDAVYRAQLEALTHEILRLGEEYGKSTVYPEGLLLGSINTHVRRILEDMRRIRGRPTGFYDKWLFQATDLPKLSEDLPDGMSWDVATLEDCEIVVARTDIPRTACVNPHLSHFPGLTT